MDSKNCEIFPYIIYLNNAQNRKINIYFEAIKADKYLMLCMGGKLLSLKAYFIETFPPFPVNTSYAHVNLRTYANRHIKPLYFYQHTAMRRRVRV